jgi:hypothetical protein
MKKKGIMKEKKRKKKKSEKKNIWRCLYDTSPVICSESGGGNALQLYFNDGLGGICTVENEGGCFSTGRRIDCSTTIPNSGGGFTRVCRGHAYVYP